MKKYHTRTFYADKQKSDMLDRWQRRDFMISLGRHFNRALSSIFLHLAQFGGRQADSALSHASQTSGPERPYNTRQQQRNLEPVLQRPIETTSHCRH
jgi:hypothetical protein